jgi:hypothetical protein
LFGTETLIVVISCPKDTREINIKIFVKIVFILCFVLKLGITFLQLGEVADFEALTFNLELNFF